MFTIHDVQYKAFLHHNVHDHSGVSLYTFVPHTTVIPVQNLEYTGLAHMAAGSGFCGDDSYRNHSD